MASSKNYREAEREQEARERGRTIPHYTGKVVKALATRGKKGSSTPSKRGSK